MPASKITFPDKNTGDLLTGAEVTEIKTVTNSQADNIDSMGTPVPVTANYNLPASSGFVGSLRLINRSGSDWSVIADGSDTIEGSANQTIFNGETFDLMLNGINWTI